MGKVKAKAFSVNLSKGDFFLPVKTLNVSYCLSSFHCQIGISLKHCVKRWCKSLVSGCISALNTRKERQGFFKIQIISITDSPSRANYL